MSCKGSHSKGDEGIKDDEGNRNKEDEGKEGEEASGSDKELATYLRLLSD